MKTEAKATPLRKPRLGSSDSEEEGEGEEGSFEVRRGAARDSGVEARRGERGVDAIRVQREREMGWLERLQSSRQFSYPLGNSKCAPLFYLSAPADPPSAL